MMASNQTQIDAPPPHTAVPMQLAVQQLAVQQPSTRLNMPSAPPQEQVKQTVRSQRPVRANPPRPQVPREFYMNANEARRVNERIVPGNFMPFFPNGEGMNYPRSPIAITCQYCCNKVVTNVEAQTNGCFIFFMIIMLLICMPFGICFCLLLRNMEDYVHKCPSCGETVGIGRSACV